MPSQALTRVAWVGTTGVAVGSCMPAASPADLVAFEPPASVTRVTVMPDRARVLSAWQLPPDNPWAPYAKLTLPSALGQASAVGALPDVMTLPEVALAQRAAERVAITGLPPGTAWIVDLRGAAAVAFGSALSRVSPTPVSVVPTFNNWPAQGELVPAEETLSAMIALAPAAIDPDAHASVPVLLLDAWRLAYKNERIDPEVVDNRYMLMPADLPTAQALRAQGIGRVVYVVGDRGTVDREEDDLNEIFLSYANAGIAIDMVDPQWLCDADNVDDDGWWSRLDELNLRVTDRDTVVGDASFYARAQGGFGGYHARPVRYGGAGYGFGGGRGG
jgi:hypothetical protein